MRLFKGILLGLSVGAMVVLSGCHGGMDTKPRHDAYISMGTAPADDDDKMEMIGKDVLPPKYLSVPSFKTCLKTQAISTYEAWCMPLEKPAKCPTSSWQQLKKLQEVPECEYRKSQ